MIVNYPDVEIGTTNYGQEGFWGDESFTNGRISGSVLPNRNGC